MIKVTQALLQHMAVKGIKTMIFKLYLCKSVMEFILKVDRPAQVTKPALQTDK